MKTLIINGQNHHGSTYHIGKELADSLFNWGIPKIYKYGMAVAATGWEEVSEKKLVKIHKDMDRLAADIKNNHGKVKPGMKLKGWFMICRMIQKNGYGLLEAKRLDRRQSSLEGLMVPGEGVSCS